MKRRISKPLVLLFAGCLAYGRAPAESCSCGKDVNEQTLYVGPASDGGFPYPSVVSITREKGGGEVRIRTGVMQGRRVIDILLRSCDDGQTWISEGEYQRVLAAPSDPMFIYAYRDGYKLFWTSSDGGREWSRPAYEVDGRPAQDFVRSISGSPDAELQVAINAIDPRNPHVVYGTFYVWVYSNTREKKVEKTYDVPAMYVSHDAGNHWSLFSSFVGNLGSDPDAYPALGISPSNPNIMMAQASGGVVRSMDGGKKWTPVGQHAELNRRAELKGRAEAVAEAMIKDPAFQPPQAEFLNLHVYNILFRPDNSNLVYLVTNKGAYILSSTKAFFLHVEPANFIRSDAEFCAMIS